VEDGRVPLRLTTLLYVAVTIWLVKQAVPVLQSISDILLLFFLAWLMAFILEPIVTLLGRMRVTRSLAVVLVYGVLLFVIALIIILVAPAVVDQLGQLRERLPTIVTQLPPEEDVSSFFAGLGLPVREISAIYHPELLAEQLQASAGALLQGALAAAAGVATGLVNMLLFLIISFYMLLDGRTIIWSVLRLIPRDYRNDAMIFLAQVSASFGGFLRGQVIQAVVFGVVVAALMIVLRLDFVAVASLTSATVMLVPIIGPVLSLLPPLGVALVQSQQTFILVALVLTPVQVVIVNVVTPKVMSGQIGMPPLVVFLAILLGLRLGGPLGAFFGIPIMGVLYGMASVLLSRARNVDDDKRVVA
jgi:predicted PurR-regulated permease PerM